MQLIIFKNDYEKNKIIDFIKDYWVLTLLIWWPVVLFIIIMISNISNTKIMVHWHIPISYDLCWDTIQLKDEWEHWKIHWHNDWRIHIEWAVDLDNRTETLWNFFDSAGINFSKTQIWKYKNGDMCPWSDKPWKLKVLINWKENNEFRDHILQKDESIKVIFK